MRILESMASVEAFLATNDKAIIVCKTHSCTVCLSIEARLNKDQAIYEGWAMGYVYVDDLALFRGGHSVFTVPTVLMFFEQKEIYRTSRFIDFQKMQYFVDVVG